MNKYSELFKEAKDNEIKNFFGEIKKTSNKYFTFNHIASDDIIIIITNNIITIRGNYVMMVSKNKAVYVNEIVKVHNYDQCWNGYAVKIKKQYFKPYTFRFNFLNYISETEDTWDDLFECAKSQNESKIALGWAKNL